MQKGKGSIVPGNNIVSVRAISRVCVWPDSLFLHCTVGERLATGVLAVPYSLWGTVGEADHIVFPVSVWHQIMLVLL